jgi:AcrR family transcriptional regulator
MSQADGLYPSYMPRLWTDTIEAHRSQVHDAILDAAARLAAERGITAMSMSEVANEAGIGRATLYKYFASVDAILVAWHETQVANHMRELSGSAAKVDDPADRVRAVLQRYAEICHEHLGSEIAAAVHHGEHMGGPRAHLTEFLSDLLADASVAGRLRDDVPPAELAAFALAATEAARHAGSKAAVDRLVGVIFSALEP